MESKAINLQVIAMVAGAVIILITAILMMFPSLYEMLCNFVGISTSHTSEHGSPVNPTDYTGVDDR